MKLLPIDTKRLKFRLINENDLDEIFSLLNNERIVKFLNMNLHTTRDDTKRLIDEYLKGLEDYSKIPYCIIEKGSNRLVGIFLLKVDLYNPSSYEMTIYLKEEFWGKGYSTEMIPAVYPVIFDELNINNFRGYIMEDNIGSCRVLEKLNFKLEKIFEVAGISGNIKSYLLTKEDYYR